MDDLTTATANGGDGALTAELLARLDALTARLDEQAARVAQVDELAGRLARLEAENARLHRAFLVSPATPSPVTPLSPLPSVARPHLGRRGLLRTGLGATVAGALLALTREAESTHAAARGSLVGATVSTIGLVAAPGSIDPQFIGLVTLSSQHGIVGIVPAMGSIGAPAISSDSGVLGLSADTYGVQGVSSVNHGIVGRTVSTSDLISGIVGITPGSGAGVRGQVSGASANTGSGVVGVAAGCEFGNASSVGVGGSGRGSGKTGVLGITDRAGIGVQGWAIGAGTGIRGSSNGGGGADFGGSGIGVEGRSGSGSGVYGQSTTGAGVFGLSTNNAAIFGTSPYAGVAGLSSNNAGVQGTSTSGAGVYGISTNNAAVFGTSPYAGVYGTSAGIGVWGVTTTGTAVYGQATSANGFAAQFAGKVFVSGSFTVLNGAKSAAVKKKDGSMARVYCQESPEPWFEDFGTADLRNGQAVVALDPEFDEVVKGDDYRVFLTSIGDLGYLYVSRKGPHRFEVKSSVGAAANGTFDYRVVARRLDPIGARLEKVELPKPAEIRQVPRALSVNELPKVPAPAADDAAR